MEIKEQIMIAVGKLGLNQEAINITPEDALHISLLFLGEIQAAHHDELQTALASLTKQTGKVEFALTDANAFPRLNQPRVLYIGVKQISGQPILQFHRLMREVLEKLSFLELDQKPYIPHITIGRIKRFTATVQKWPELFVPRLSFQVDSYELMESILEPTGARHHIVESYIL